ncbi:MAG TPA: carboxylating nicotinate-nucleotide diphosphorylase [Nitrospiraceae bacterium]|nr:carboxylating nicotinate-nucleotide diphosphorylase [Nitrospiraceae bacterium]
MHRPPIQKIRDAVRLALAEDVALGDATTAALFPNTTGARGTIVAHQSLIVAGMAVAREVCAQIDPAIRIIRAADDGRKIENNTVVLMVEGDARSLLMVERVLLNFLQRLSGIATLTALFRQATKGYPTRILDTRKTTPGLRALEKWAVRLGGGLNHRHSLGDGILIKDNHLALLRAQGRSVTDACRLARERGPHGLRIIVEAQSLAQVREALTGKADVILLDNMMPAQVRQAAGVIKGRALVEVSGGITLEIAGEMAAAGADYLSIGALTHSAPAANLSMDIVATTRSRQSGRSPKAMRR